MPTVIAFSSSCSTLPIIAANSIVPSFCQRIAIKHTFNYFNKGLICSAPKGGHCAVPKHTAAQPFSSEIKQEYHWAANPVTNTSLLDEHLRHLFSGLLFTSSACIISPWHEKELQCATDGFAIVISIILPSELPPFHFPPLITPLHACKVALILSPGESLQLATLQHPEIRDPS